MSGFANIIAHDDSVRCSFTYLHGVGRGRPGAAIVFFGTFLVTALAGMPSIDAKLARRDPARHFPPPHRSFRSQRLLRGATGSCRERLAGYRR
jgi:hypothetical protein